MVESFENTESVVDKKSKEYCLGKKFTQARTLKKWNVEDVAKKICISSTQVKAIEQGDFHLLPKEVYTLGFIRAYARLVDLDPDSIAKEYKEYVNYTSENFMEKMPFLTEKQSKSHGILILFGLVLCAAVIWVAYYTFPLEKAGMQASVKDSNAGVVDTQTTKISNPKSLQSKPLTRIVKRKASTKTQIHPLPTKEKEGVSVASKAVIQDSAKSKTTVKRVAVAKSPAQKGEEVKTPQYVFITALQNVYVSVKTKQNTAMYDDFLGKGQTIKFPLDKGYFINSGDGSFITFSIEGIAKNVILGKRGTVLRELPLSLKRIKALL